MEIPIPENYSQVQKSTEMSNNSVRGLSVLLLEENIKIISFIRCNKDGGHVYK